MVDYENFYGNGVEIAAHVTQEYLDEHEKLKNENRTLKLKVIALKKELKTHGARITEY